MVDGGISPEYFWNELSDAEMYYIAKRVNENKKEAFERTRLLAYVVVSSLGGKVDYSEFLNIGDQEDLDNLTPEQVEMRKKLLIEAYKKAK